VNTRATTPPSVATSAGPAQQVNLLTRGLYAVALRSLAPQVGRLSVIAWISAALGVAAAGLLAMVLTEATLVAPVAKACAANDSCLSPANETFLSELADAGWNDLTALSIAAGTLIVSLGTLAVLGWAAKSVRVWQAAPMVVGIVGIYATNTVLHGDAKYGLTLALLASASIAVRMIRRSHHG
jgi:hypothetical protein